MKNWKFPLLAAVVFGALLAYVLWGGPAPTSEEEVEPPSEEIRMVDLSPEDINLITVQWEDLPDLAISAAEGEEESVFQLISPFERATDQDRARLLFSSASQLRASRIISEETEDLSQYGLEDPSGAIILTLADGEEVTMHIGDTSPLNTDSDPDRYVRVDDEDIVYLVDGIRLAFFLTPPDKWRDPVVLRLDADEVQSIEVRSGSREWIAARTDDPYGWQLLSPLAAPAKSSVAEDILWRLGSLRVERFEMDNPTPEQLEEYGLDAPSMRISFHKSSGATSTLLVGLFADDQAAEVYAKVEGQPFVYVISSGSLGGTGLGSAMEWVAATVFSPARFSQVTSLQWEIDGQRRRLVRGEDHWLMELPSGEQVEIPSEDAEPAIRALLRAEAHDLRKPDQPLGEYGLAPPRGRVEVNFTSEDDEVHTVGLDIGEAGETSHARVDGYDAVFLFDSDLNQLLEDLTGLQ
ncbi:MAG: DUF4340 domain-containing protein [Bacillota bacterium]